MELHRRSRPVFFLNDAVKMNYFKFSMQILKFTVCWSFGSNRNNSYSRVSVVTEFIKDSGNICDNNDTSYSG